MKSLKDSEGEAAEPDPDQLVNAMNAFFRARTLAQLSSVVESFPELLTEKGSTGLRNLVTLLEQQGHPNAPRYIEHLVALDQLTSSGKLEVEENVPPAFEQGVQVRQRLDSLPPTDRARSILQHLLQGSPIALEVDDLNGTLFTILAEMQAHAVPGSDIEQQLERVAAELRQLAVQVRMHRRMGSVD